MAVHGGVSRRAYGAGSVGGVANGAHSSVYVGKATKITLARRLAEHAAKIGGRQTIEVVDVWCRYLVIGAKPGEEWVAASAESALIHHYKPKWNKSGFGGHAPGAGRPGKDAVPWDTWHPKK